MLCTTVYTLPAGSEEVGVLVPDPADGAVPYPLHPAVQQPGLAQDRGHVTGVGHHKLGTTAECGQCSGVWREYLGCVAVWSGLLVCGVS